LATTTPEACCASQIYDVGMTGDDVPKRDLLIGPNRKLFDKPIGSLRASRLLIGAKHYRLNFNLNGGVLQHV
jgi:hypothetical protein